MAVASGSVNPMRRSNRTRAAGAADSTLTTVYESHGDECEVAADAATGAVAGVEIKTDHVAAKRVMHTAPHYVCGVTLARADDTPDPTHPDRKYPSPYMLMIDHTVPYTHGVHDGIAALTYSEVFVELAFMGVMSVVKRHKAAWFCPNLFESDQPHEWTNLRHVYDACDSLILVQHLDTHTRSNMVRRAMNTVQLIRQLSNAVCALEDVPPNIVARAIENGMALEAHDRDAISAYMSIVELHTSRTITTTNVTLT
jgi:hypothetical protein